MTKINLLKPSKHIPQYKIWFKYVDCNYMADIFDDEFISKLPTEMIPVFIDNGISTTFYIPIYSG